MFTKLPFEFSHKFTRKMCFVVILGQELRYFHPFHTQNHLSHDSHKILFLVQRRRRRLFFFSFSSNFAPITHNGTHRPNEWKCHCKAENFVRLNLETRQSRVVRFVPTDDSESRAISFGLSLAHSHVRRFVSLMLCILYFSSRKQFDFEINDCETAIQIDLVCRCLSMNLNEMMLFWPSRKINYRSEVNVNCFVIFHSITNSVISNDSDLIILDRIISAWLYQMGLVFFPFLQKKDTKVHKCNLIRKLFCLNETLSISMCASKRKKMPHTIELLRKN